MSEIVYLNGEFMPADEARIPVLDRGFIFGDGVYEVIPVYSRRPFRLPEHFAASAAQPRRDAHREPHDRTPNGRASSTRSSRAMPATTSRSTCRSRAAWRSAITRFPRTRSRRYS